MSSIPSVPVDSGKIPANIPPSVEKKSGGVNIGHVFKVGAIGLAGAAVVGAVGLATLGVLSIPAVGVVGAGAVVGYVATLAVATAAFATAAIVAAVAARVFGHSTPSPIETKISENDLNTFLKPLRDQIDTYDNPPRKISHQVYVDFNRLETFAVNQKLCTFTEREG